MYFATNLPMPTVPLEIAQEFEELYAAQPDAAMHLYALIDCCFDEEFLNTRYRRTLAPLSLYEDTVLEQFGASAPHLLTSPEGEGESAAWLKHLFASCGNKPMLSILASPLTADELRRHMRPYLIAMTPDTVEWPVRWGDTRVLPAMLDALTETQRCHFLGPIGRWWSPARDGSLLRWNGSIELPTVSGFDKLPLSDEAFVSLVERAEPDAVLMQIDDRQPDVLRLLSPAGCHAAVRRHLTLASASGIDTADSRRHFSVLALVLREEFSSYPEIAQMLQRMRGGADYRKEASALSPEFWHAMARI